MNLLCALLLKTNQMGYEFVFKNAKLKKVFAHYDPERLKAVVKMMIKQNSFFLSEGTDSDILRYVWRFQSTVYGYQGWIYSMDEISLRLEIRASEFPKENQLTN